MSFFSFPVCALLREAIVLRPSFLNEVVCCCEASGRRISILSSGDGLESMKYGSPTTNS